jgi:hypothetical protein
MQDKLKDLSNKQLMYYIENPQISSGAMTGSSLGQGGANTLPGAMLAGHVPAYLVIGELGRREKMRAKFSQAAPTETVSEQIIQEAVPQGIGALMPTNMPPPMAPSPESVTETGIANLPAPNVGQNYEAGGIVGYAGGGGLVSFTDEETDEYVLDPLTGLPQIVEKTDEQEVRQADPVNVSPNEYLPYAPEVGSVFGMPKEPNLEDYKTDLVDEQKAFGMDPEYFKKEREAIRAERGDIQRQEDTALNTALMRAGLGMAAGKSQFALSNVAEGAQLGLEGYVKDKADIKKEQKLYDKEERALRGMERAEQKGDAAGYKTYKKEVVATQLKLIEVDGDLKAKALTRGIAADTAEAEIRIKALADARDGMAKKYGTTQALIAAFSKNKENYDKEFQAEFKRAYKIFSKGREFTEKIDTVAPTGVYDPAAENSEKTNYWEN